jgi:hypothetical protein
VKVGDLVKHTRHDQTFVGLVIKRIKRSSLTPDYDRWAVLYNGLEWTAFALHLEVISESG